MTQKIDLNNLDKSTWETFKFEDIAQKISETVNPNTTDLDIYLGLEHIDAEDIHIRRQGTPDDVSGGKLRCYPNDVIFGKRRAYQRKAAIVNFNGICSAHAFVFRANTEVIVPKLFPFFLHSDQFMHRMVDISVGGLSPTINWGDLKGQEFLLPPKDQQAKLAELLWAMDEVVERENEVLIRLKTNRISNVYDEIAIARNSKNYIKLGDIVNITTGKLDSNAAVEYGEYPFFTCSPDTFKIDVYAFDTKAILLAGNNASGIFPLKYFEGKFNAYQRTYVITLKTSDLSYEYLLEIIRLELENLRRLSVGSSTKFLTISVLTKMKIPLISLSKQKKMANKVYGIDDAINKSLKMISSSKALQKSLINQVF